MSSDGHQPFFAPERHVTELFELRSYRPGDGPLLAEAVNASYEHLRPWMPWAVPEQGVEASEALCRRFRGEWLVATDFVIGAFAPDGDRLLGGAGYHLREGPLSRRSAEMGMWVRADESGAGLGTAMLVALLRWGFADWPWLRLSWRCDLRNAASVRIAEKAGLLREGTLRSHDVAVDGTPRDTACFAALREEWREPVGRGTEPRTP